MQVRMQVGLDEGISISQAASKLSARRQSYPTVVGGIDRESLVWLYYKRQIPNWYPPQ